MFLLLPKDQTFIFYSTEKVHKNQNKAFEWEILKDPKLIWMMVSQTLLALAFMIPFTYLPDVINSLGYR